MEILVFDTESNGFLDTADKLWCTAVVSYNSDFERLYEPDEVQQSLYDLAKADVLVGHNIKKHDLPLIKKLYGWEPSSHQIVLDTLVYSRMLYPKRPLPQGYTGKSPHSIEAWGYRLGLSKPEHEDWTQYTPEMGKRCLEDARINKLLLLELEREAGDLPMYYKQAKSIRSTAA